MSHSLRRKIFVVFIVALFGAFLVLINVVVHQNNLRWDLTEAKQHTLSEVTQDYLSNLDEKITITALVVGIPPKYLEDMFKEYERIGKGKITTKIIDPLVDIGYAAQFGNIITGKQKKVVVQSGQQRRDIDFTEDVLTEELLTNAIIRVSRTNRQICFLTGHNEYKLGDEDDHGLSILAQLMATNNMDARTLMLTPGSTIPTECDVLVIAGPKKHLLEEEEKMINDFLVKGGDALFLVEHIKVTTPDQPLSEEDLNLNPSLNGILKNWGIKVNKDVVVDIESHAAGDVGSPATNNYLAHRAIVSDLDYTFYVRPRSISILPDRRETLKVAPIVLTSSAQSSWGETDRTLNVEFDNILDRAGPVPIAFVIWEPKEEDESSDTRIIVFTDADFLTNAYITAYSNAQMGLNAINWLSELDYKVFLDKEKFEVNRLDLTSAQKRNVLWILVAMPALIALGGMLVGWRQR